MGCYLYYRLKLIGLARSRMCVHKNVKHNQPKWIKCYRLEFQANVKSSVKMYTVNIAVKYLLNLSLRTAGSTKPASRAD